MLKGKRGDNRVRIINFKPPLLIIFSKSLILGNLLINVTIFLTKYSLARKKDIDAPMKALKKTTIEPKYGPYKKPAKKDNQEAGKINKTETI